MYGGNNSNPGSGNNLNNRYGNSYQQGGGGSYVPPGQTYAEKQTNILVDTVQTQYQTEGNAANVLSQMHMQRNQLQGAHQDAYKMKEATDLARKEIEVMGARFQRKRMRLYFIIAALSLVDLFLFWRLAKCGGSFFC